MEDTSNLGGTIYSRPDIIIEGGILVSMVTGEEPIPNARVSIKGDKIVEIQTGYDGPRPPGVVETIDARSGIIMPGLVNAHSHTAMTLFRGLSDDLPLKQWLFEKIFPAESKYLAPETVYWGAMLGCLEMIASGTTCLADGYFFQDDTFRAVRKSGLRALIAQGIIDFPAPGVSDPKKNLTVGKEFLERWIGHSDLIAPGLFCHSPITCSEETLKKAMRISRDFSLPLQIHLSETSDEVGQILKRTGLRPVHYLEKIGLLGEDLIASHGVHLDGGELELLSRKGVKLVHAPESNMKLSSGVAPVSEMVRMGLSVGLGTDGCASNNNLDLFQEMDSASKLAKVFTRNPTSLDARTVLKMATLGGAVVLGLEKEVGSIEVGKKADIIVVDLQSPHLVPLYDPFSAVVYSASGADVKDVLVNGRVLMKDRKFRTLDPVEIMENVTAICRGITV